MVQATDAGRAKHTYPPDIHLTLQCIMHLFFLQGDMAGLDRGGEENGGGVGEFLCRLGGEVFARAARSEGTANRRMAREIITERQGNDVALSYGLRLRIMNG